MIGTDQCISIFKVVPPVWSDLPLTTNVPHVQLEALGLHTLYVEPL